MIRAALRPLSLLWERTILMWALRELRPTHQAVPAIVRRLNDCEHAPSPLDPADSIVVGGCVVATVCLLGFSLAGWLQ